MRRLNREINIFNLSMLDVMTGALGAVMIIMIVLLTQKIGIESMTCQDVKEELITTTDTLSKTTEELTETRKELQTVRENFPEKAGTISALTKTLNATADKFSEVIKKVTDIDKNFFKTPEDDDKLMAFQIPHKIVMVVDLSGSMAPENNRYKEDRLSQVKAALKMFIAAMDEKYQIDIVFFPAFAENISREQCPGFTIKPDIDSRCRKFERRDEAYDSADLPCYKYGYFEGSLMTVSSEKEKYDFYKKIACLKPYHDTPTEYALEYILTRDPYRSAEGIILFSDGQPDSLRKKTTTKNELLKRIKSMNRRNMKIFTMGIGTEFRNQEDTEAVDFLRQLASQNNGFYIGF